MDKVEAFKKSHDNGSALHAKYNLSEFDFVDKVVCLFVYLFIYLFIYF